MKKPKNIYFVAALIFISGALARPPYAASFDIPEKLSYDLTWAGIKTGEASLEIRDNGSHIQFISKAVSAKETSSSGLPMMKREYPCS